MQPRIYTYKITFEETPDWYWGVHKEKVYGELYTGSPVAHAWKWDFYTPKVQICQLFPYSEEGWAEAHCVESQCIRPDLNNPLCLNEHCGGDISLEACRRGGKKGGTASHVEKNEEGKSIHAVKVGKFLHLEKNEEGKSVASVKGGVESAKTLHSEKTEEGKSFYPAKGGEKTSSYRYRCLKTGHVAPPGPLSRYQIARGIDTSLRVKID